MTAEHYIQEKELLSQALNGKDNLDGAVDAITNALAKYRLDLMPVTAFDIFCFTLETLHLGKFTAPERTPFDGNYTAQA